MQKFLENSAMDGWGAQEAVGWRRGWGQTNEDAFAWAVALPRLPGMEDTWQRFRYKN